MVKRLILLLCTLTLGLGLRAQAPAGPGEGAGPGRSDRKDTVRLFVVHKMRENLGLSDAQTLKVLDVLEAIDTERESVQLARRTQMDKIQTLLADPASPESAYKDVVAQFQKSQEQSETKMRELEGRLLATMTPKQQAQFLLLRRQLYEEVRQDVQRGRAARGGGGGAGAGGGLRMRQGGQ
jgi:Spy/CpxP family protein refolding chaperone